VVLRCFFCGHTPDWTGPLCLEPVPYEPKDDRLVCKACVLQGQAFDAEMKLMAEDLADRAAHYASCSFCWGNKRLLLPGPLAQACLERRKAKEAEEARRVA
jgi:hypothetical protein